jgi:hypothetical protein
VTTSTLSLSLHSGTGRVKYRVALGLNVNVAAVRNHDLAQSQRTFTQIDVSNRTKLKPETCKRVGNRIHDCSPSLSRRSWAGGEADFPALSWIPCSCRSRASCQTIWATRYNSRAVMILVTCRGWPLAGGVIGLSRPPYRAHPPPMNAPLVFSSYSSRR